MRSLFRIIAGLALFLWILVFALQPSACIFTGRNQRGIMFRPGTGVNILLLREYCTSTTCTVTESQIIYQSHYDARVAVVVGRFTPRFSQSVELSTINIVVPEKETTGDAHKTPIYTMNLKELDWNAAMALELSILLTHGLLYGISEEDITAIAATANDSGTFVYYKPKACGNSYHIGNKTDSDKSGWLVGAGNCQIDAYFECPSIGCYRCKGSPLGTSFLPTLPLQFPLIEGEK